MARIATAELERLKREVSLERLVEAHGVELRRHGKDLLGLCPFHADREPSLVVSPEKNLWHCLGACRQGGSVIDWVMKVEGVSFRHAVELLRQSWSPSSDSSGPPEGEKKRSEVRKLPSPVEVEARDGELLGQVIDYYHATLLESEEALEYLASRGLRSEEAIERFRLGFANRTLGYRLPAKNRQEGAALRSRLQTLGILRESGHEHFNGSLVVPVFDRQGAVVEVYGRKIGERLRAGTPLHLYLPGPHRGVWNLEGLSSSKEVILCESLLDGLTFWCAGFRNVTSSYGIEGFTTEHAEALEAYGIARVLIAYDRDEAGERAAQALGKRLLERGIGCYRVRFPKGMDANEYACKVAPAAKSLDLVLRQAEWMGTGPPPQIAVPAVEEEISEEPTQAEASPAAEPVPIGELETETDDEPNLPLSDPSPPLAASPSPSPKPPASQLPITPRLSIPCEVSEGEVVIRLGDRRYRVRGLERNLTLDALKVNLLASRGEAFHVDTFDLYSAPKRKSFLEQVVSELGLEPEVAKRDLGRVLLKLEELQAEAIESALRPQAPTVELSPDEQDEALRHLESPGLLARTREHLGAVGIVGEETNKLVLYLAATSRKLERPLAVLVQSSSAAGKSALMEGVLALVPEEERVAYSAMTGQSLFYMGEKDLRHKVLAIAEGEGMERASYALKLLQSEGKVSIASTGKDPQTGRLQTHEYVVEGPAAILTTSTQIDLDEEFENRCLVLTVDESREQTEAIHRFQRRAETLEGLAARARRERLRKLHQNAQRLLRPLDVVIPFAERLRYPSTSTRTRRDHEKYLALIRSIVLVHQHQRRVRRLVVDEEEREVVEATLEDIELANALASEVLGRTLDELPPQSQRLLELVRAHVLARCAELGVEREDYRLTRREIRESTGWGNTQLHMHLNRLADLEYLLVHRGSRGQRFVYELLWDGEGSDGERFVLGLLDPEEAEKREYDANLSGSAEEFSGSIRPQFGVNSGSFRGGGNGDNPLFSQSFVADRSTNAPENASSRNAASVVAAARRSGIQEG